MPDCADSEWYSVLFISSPKVELLLFLTFCHHCPFCGSSPFHLPPPMYMYLRLIFSLLPLPADSKIYDSFRLTLCLGITNHCTGLPRRDCGEPLPPPVLSLCCSICYHKYSLNQYLLSAHVVSDDLSLFPSPSVSLSSLPLHTFSPSLSPLPLHTFSPSSSLSHPFPYTLSPPLLSFPPFEIPWMARGRSESEAWKPNVKTGKSLWVHTITTRDTNSSPRNVSLKALVCVFDLAAVWSHFCLKRFAEKLCAKCSP